MAFKWDDASVSRALRVEPTAGAQASGVYSSVSTDSRSIEEGALFVALVGEHFDGHDYVSAAVQAGAKGFVVSRELNDEVPPDVSVFRVADTLVAYGALAAHKRAVLGASVVGITGSSGKTTTKDLTTGALSSTLRTHATQANYNNRVGLPRTILEAPHNTEVLVLEMGTNEPGEIAALTGVASPDIGVVTTVAESHLEGLGSLEGVMNEKLDLLRGLKPSGTALVGEEPDQLRVRARALVPQLRVAGLSRHADPDLRATHLRVQPDGAFHFTWQDQEVALRIPGDVAVVDALLALGVAEALGVPASEAVRGVGSVGPGWMRGEVRAIGGLTVILDCYNANPVSVRAATRTLTSMPSKGPRVLVLGSMLELGSEAANLHARTLGEVAKAPLDRIYTEGLFQQPAQDLDEDHISWAADVDALAQQLSAELSGNETILLKASRGVRLEGVVPALEGTFGGGDPHSRHGGGAA